MIIENCVEHLEAKMCVLSKSEPYCRMNQEAGCPWVTLNSSERYKQHCLVESNIISKTKSTFNVLSTVGKLFKDYRQWKWIIAALSVNGNTVRVQTHNAQYFGIF